jgi:hypothetical protein
MLLEKKRRLTAELFRQESITFEQGKKYINGYNCEIILEITSIQVKVKT